MGAPKSELRDGMRIDWDVPIEVDDGLVLKADVLRPDSPSRYPELRPLRQGSRIPGRLSEPRRESCVLVPVVRLKR